MDWTEEDEIGYETDLKEQKRKIIQKKLDEAQRRYDEAERSYQETGSASTMRTMNNNENMMMICRLALQALDNVCGRCEMHRRTAVNIANKYKKAQGTNDRDLLDFDTVISDIMDLQF